MFWIGDDGYWTWDNGQIDGGKHKSHFTEREMAFSD